VGVDGFWSGERVGLVGSLLGDVVDCAVDVEVSVGF